MVCGLIVAGMMMVRVDPTKVASISRIFMGVLLFVFILFHWGESEYQADLWGCWVAVAGALCIIVGEALGLGARATPGPSPDS